MFTVESFCDTVWTSPYADVCQNVTKDSYRQFEIPKKGGTRVINYVEKGSELWKLQRCLLDHFLAKRGLPSCVKGFRKGESYRSFLSAHIGAAFFLRIDIESFFPSITSACVRSELSKFLDCPEGPQKDMLLDLICDIVTLDGRLPQGACTSPAVSNLVMAEIDRRIDGYCKWLGVCYTRYADDLLFSSRNFRFAKSRFVKKIKYILRSKGLKLNNSKLKFGQNEMVLNGYVISDRGIRLSRSRLSDIRHMTAFARDYDGWNGQFEPNVFLAQANRRPLEHRDLQRHPFLSVWSFVQYLRGYRAFLISMMDQTASPFQAELRRLIRRLEVQIARYQQVSEPTLNF